MPALFTTVRPLVLAALLGLTLTSCFERDKKCDPKPSTCGSTKTTSPTTGSGGSN